MARKRVARGGNGGATGSAGTLKFMNRTITIMRGLQVNLYGDLSDVGIPRYVGVQAALAETEQTYFDAASQRNQIIRSIECHVPAWVDIQTTDTIMDEATGRYYMIEGVREQPGIGYYPAPKILSLRMRSGVNVDSD
jgi:hypothetical protein